MCRLLCLVLPLLALLAAVPSPAAAQRLPAPYIAIALDRAAVAPGETVTATATLRGDGLAGAFLYPPSNPYWPLQDASASGGTLEKQSWYGVLAPSVTITWVYMAPTDTPPGVYTFEVCSAATCASAQIWIDDTPPIAPPSSWVWLPLAAR